MSSCRGLRRITGVVAAISFGGLAFAEEPKAARVSVTASAAVSIGAGRPADLIAATIKATQPEGVLLVVATIQLEYSGTPTHKTVELSIHRDAAPLDAPYTVRVGTAARAVSEIPVTLHAWDTPGEGAHRYVVQARSSDPGVRATARRLTVIEFRSN
ncbi:MAG: hypothetical protein HY598_01070 [Candidatus Omnitrophica bacterium]|nr:hypothetical protein [Candidatus Omnitrophota bacterium]